ncbi:type VII toxin-antitoxin system MntA family adenylyltransferase antitoxin [Methanocrinis sp.]|uniref:type VII toxin-antitoxin system MntA family adenylyltransferase antitoxin n=1 Tax=Methanocrinis sp. TaxID=3101522 RepID=UPI003D10F861
MGIPERWAGHRPLPEEIRSSLEELAGLFEEEGVILAYLFGSLARDETDREPHDVDLAVLTATQEEPAWRLWEKIVDALGTERLDLVDLRRASPVLRFEIVRSGRPIYVSDEAARERFVLDTLHLYPDTAPMRRRQMESLRKRMMKCSEESLYRTDSRDFSSI